MRLCIIIPAYNEAATIGELIKLVKNYAQDVLVVNDGSADETGNIAQSAGALVINLKENVGKGTALKTGFKRALENNYDAVLTMDADGQHLPEDIIDIVKGAALPDAGIIVGNRMTNPEGMPLIRFITNLFMSLVISLVARQNIPDTQCGFRLIKRELLKQLKLISSNYEIESEMLIRASKLGFKIRSIAVKSVYDGQLSLIHPVMDTWRFLIMLFKVLWRAR